MSWAMIRVDADERIGLGHVMRCLTLAEKLQSRFAHIVFFSRSMPVFLIDKIRAMGFVYQPLELELEQTRPDSGPYHHSPWLDRTEEDDAKQCLSHANTLSQQLGELNVVLVDHYALGAPWERQLKAQGAMIVVIDDLADRKHQCDILLDQTFGRSPADYQSLVPQGATLLCGSAYALLRDEFSRLREQSLKKRDTSRKISHILVNLGGSDVTNVTSIVLEALADSALPAETQLSIIMGGASPHIEQVRDNTSGLPFETKVLSNVSDMARRMHDADLSIGAAGSSSWERCCLGLPTIMISIASNQEFAARQLHEAEIAIHIRNDAMLKSHLRASLEKLLGDQHYWLRLSQNARKITTGNGASQLLEIINDHTNQ